MSRLASTIFLQTAIPGLDAGDVKTLQPKRKLIAFGWYGGKFNHLGWLLSLLPKGHHYCEPFGGSAAVLLNREPSPVETYNDIDGDVPNFFRVSQEFIQEDRRINPGLKYVDVDNESSLMSGPDMMNLAKEIFGPYLR